MAGKPCKVSYQLLHRTPTTFRRNAFSTQGSILYLHAVDFTITPETI